MANIVASRRFVATHRLPALPLWVSGSLACATLAKAESGALIAVDGELPRYLISGWFLKVAVEVAAKQMGAPSALTLPLSEQLVAFWDPSRRLIEAVEARFKGAGRNPELAVVAIGDSPLLHNAAEPAFEGLTLWSVLGPSGIPAGWYSADDTLLEVIQTPPDTWICTNEPPHKNADPDSGKCRSCGKALIL